MTPQEQAKTLRKALSALYKGDDETAPAIVTPNERSELLTLIGYIQIALDRTKARVFHAPRDASFIHSLAPMPRQLATLTREAAQ